MTPASIQPTRAYGDQLSRPPEWPKAHHGSSFDAAPPFPLARSLNTSWDVDVKSVSESGQMDSRHRWKRIRQQDPELFRSAIDVGILSPFPPHSWSLDMSESDSSDDQDWAWDDELLDGECVGNWIEPRHFEFEPSSAWRRDVRNDH